MNKTNQTLIVTNEALTILDECATLSTIDYKMLKNWCKSGEIIQKFRHYSDVTFYYDFSPKYRRAALLSWLAYFLKKRSSSINYLSQGEVKVSLSFLLKRTLILMRDLLKKPFFLRSLNSKIALLHQKIPSSVSLPLLGSPYYFRTDFQFNLVAGGSVGHIAGVLNNLEAPVFLTSTTIPTVKEEIDRHVISCEDKFLDYDDLPVFAFSETYAKRADALLESKRPQFIYERFSLGSTSGVELSQKFQVPFVLEYNGSEIWISKHWGKPFHHEKLFIKIEELNLHAAQLIVVVSSPLKEELVERGVDARKILVNPNGVDPEKYSPSIDGNAMREELNFGEKCVIGFIGTFGKWHGAEVLAESFGALIKEHPEYRETVHLLMIGGGVTMPRVVESIKKYHLEESVTLTGPVPQAEAPLYLAACDIFASPHVPNSDGSKFFGSPTKLFEYMALGSGIVASDLEQIGEILDHKRTAWLVKPGDKHSLTKGLKELIDNPRLRSELGKNAREEVVDKYTWREHTRKIITRLRELCPS
ncbi:MAG: GDP-mannose-dependent alpha-(1-6)-phosphatidylinositol monomannoside mannosyltransferase [Chlamydiae bacterium]|nr:GDP-mannose-dependent alpha-(1-6)-phosphatidylinositol monomannoside mannosyltransferase [Chlamydiota bacterium]